MGGEQSGFRSGHFTLAERDLCTYWRGG